MDEKNFIYFIENSSIEYYNKGNNGIILLVTLNKDLDSPYKYNNLDKYNKSIDKIILKIIFITNEDDEHEIFLDNEFQFDQKTEEEFKKEVNSQVDIYFKSISYLEPICPQVFYSNIYNKSVENKYFLKKIIKKTRKRQLENIILQYNGDIDKFGIIAMEYIPNKTLHYYTYHNYYANYKNMARYLLLKLAIDTGYTHADFHAGNFFIDPEYFCYFKDIRGKPFLIDFTWAEKIPNDKLIEIKKNYDEGKYKEALFIISKIPRRDDINLKEFEVFNWITSEVNYTVGDNHIIHSLVEKRELAINNMIELFNKMDDIEKYPILPISNEIKNSLYKGFF
jgi:hypothetical protein